MTRQHSRKFFSPEKDQTWEGGGSKGGLVKYQAFCNFLAPLHVVVYLINICCIYEHEPDCKIAYLISFDHIFQYNQRLFSHET